MTIRGVIFDMGGTLLNFDAPGTTWEDTEYIAARSVYRRLRQEGAALPPEEEAVDTACAHSINVWRTLGQQAVHDLKLSVQVRLMAEAWGVKSVSPPLAEALAWAYMEAIRRQVYPVEGAGATLRALRAMGLRLGLLSNTHWPAHVHISDLDQHGLTRYLDHTVFSSEAGTWKPDAKAFRLTLDGLGLAAAETVFVGDSLYWDIWGAQQAGMRAIWIDQPSQVVPDGMEITPDASIHHFPEVIDVVKGWQQDG